MFLSIGPTLGRFKQKGLFGIILKTPAFVDDWLGEKAVRLESIEII
jgi:hypothetical protein